MQAYRKAGVNMYNSVYSQAKMGKAVSLKNIEAGDLIICNNYGHVAMYIGGGKIVHAMSNILWDQNTASLQISSIAER